MSRIERLAESYRRHISVPWQSDVAPSQRVIFCVYDEKDELRLRFRIGEFEIATKEAGHAWVLFDVTDTFAQWLASNRYAKRYFERPDDLRTCLPKYLTFISDRFDRFIEAVKADENTVVAVKGVGSLFGFLKVKDVVDKLAPKVKGRLLVFFPGSYESNNYRLFDAYDGWNYRAVPITDNLEN